jgi:thymidylate synthase (FAD)
MKLIRPSFQILTNLSEPSAILKRIESAGRTCYKSEDKITEESAEKFVATIIKSGHESVIEHESICVKFICDRGVSHEIVRHRLASFSQESTRYCNYSKEKFGSRLTFIIPPWVVDNPLECNDRATEVWLSGLTACQSRYLSLLELGWAPQQARAILPNSLKTEIVVTANLREWRTILKQRTSLAAHPQMQELMVPLLAELKKLVPVIFDDINP